MVSPHFLRQLCRVRFVRLLCIVRLANFLYLLYHKEKKKQREKAAAATKKRGCLPLCGPSGCPGGYFHIPEAEAVKMPRMARKWQALFLLARSCRQPAF